MQLFRNLVLAAVLAFSAVPALAQPVSSATATAANQVTANTYIGAPGSTVCATDTGTCSLNAIMKRIASRESSVITALGAPFQAGGSIGNTVFGATKSGSWVLDGITGTIALPTGAATASLQTTANSALATIVSNTGAATPAGTNVIGRVGIDQTTDGTTNKVSVGNITGTVSLPTGASTSAHQVTLNTATGAPADTAWATGSGSIIALLKTIAAAALDTSAVLTDVSKINGVTPSMGNGVSGTGVQRVTIASDSTFSPVLAASTANIGDVDVLTLPALSAGTNNIGDVDVLTLPALPAGSNLIGGVKLTDTGGSTNATVKAASTQAATTDTAMVVAQSPLPNTVCTSSVAISQTASTDVITPTAKVHICAIVLVSETAQAISVIEGTGTVCATSGVALIGSTTAANGMPVAANGGFSAPTDRPWLKSKTTANHICVTQSGSGRVSGVITYADAS